MKQKKALSALAAGAVVMGLLLGASQAQAAEVILDANNNVTQIKNLEVFEDQGGVTVYDVDFVNATGLNVYGSNFDFTFTQEEDAFNALEQVTDALNAHDPTPVGASSQGTDQFFIGVEHEQESVGDFIAAVGGENIGGIWDQCEIDCIVGTKVLQADVPFTYAKFSPPSGAEPALVAASLPSSRSVQIGNVASAFATIINTSGTTVTDCSIAPQTSVAATFAYQTTDAANVPAGTANTPADIPAGGSQNFIFAFTPTAPIDPTDVRLTYDCSNSSAAPVTLGLNTLLLSASTDPVPDIVALSATPSGDGIVNLPGTNGSNAFSVATVNVGSADTITASAEPSMTLPLSLSICETNPATGACLSAPASSATSSVGAGATPTYSIFVTGNGTVPFDPANNRIFVEFWDAGGAVRGSTSVAVRTQ